VIDDDAANRHRFTLSTPGLGSLLSGSDALTGRLRGPGVAREHRVGRHLVLMHECPVPGPSRCTHKGALSAAREGREAQARRTSLDAPVWTTS
jgi:hypothetical protein